MYSTANAFHRQEYAGAFQLLMEAATERGVKIRILTPEDELILETERNLMIVKKKPHGEISIRYIQPRLQTKTSITIVDKKYSLAIELKEKTTSIEAILIANIRCCLMLRYLKVFGHKLTCINN